MAVPMQGVRASARSVIAAEAGFRQGAALMANGVSQHLLPAVRTRVPTARGARPAPSGSEIRVGLGPG